MSERLATEREPRPIITDPVELGVFLESPEPPLGLGQTEVNMIVGRPPQNLQTGEGHRPGFKGLQRYSRHQFLTYRRDDGRVLTYRYEGFLAYALVLDPDSDQSSGSGEGRDRG
ncbi:MAG TPA: hypothetical protein VEP94_06605 [Solirubrobacterales bacterium]|nr:hypothetical protein [Solirubrobacterales bacterium]